MEQNKNKEPPKKKADEVLKKKADSIKKSGK